MRKTANTNRINYVSVNSVDDFQQLFCQWVVKIISDWLAMLLAIKTLLVRLG